MCITVIDFLLSFYYTLSIKVKQVYDYQKAKRGF